MGKKKSKRARKKEAIKRQSMSEEEKQKNIILENKKKEDLLSRQKENKALLDQRLKEIQKRGERISPPFLVCNDCGHEMSRESFEYHREYIEGLDLFISAYCKDCDSDTYGILGTQEACFIVRHFLASNSKKGSILGPLISIGSKLDENS